MSAPPTIECTGIPAGSWDFSLYATNIGGNGPAQAIGSVPQAICGPSPSIPGYLAIGDSFSGSSDQVVTAAGAAYLTLPAQGGGTSAILFDGAGNMLVASGSNGSVTYFPVGCSIPSTVLYTEGFGIHSIAINAAGELAIAGVDNLVRVFPPGATTPGRVLSGGTSINAVIWDFERQPLCGRDQRRRQRGSALSICARRDHPDLYNLDHRSTLYIGL